MLVPLPPVTTASPQGGSFTSAQSISLSSNETGVTYYTTDGSTPDTTSFVYTSAISLSSDTTLKFFTIDSANNSETIKTETYTITTGPVCGNNTIESGETCDGTDLNSQSCVSQGFASGTLSCNSNCQSFNTSSCANPPAGPTCGNGALETGEACDDGNTVSGDGCSSSCTVEVAQASAARGYVSRDCGFDLDQDGIIGEPNDCTIGNGVTTDPDKDGVDEDFYYVDCDGGSDTTGDGSPGNPYLTLEHAFSQLDGAGDGAEDIIPFTGTCDTLDWFHFLPNHSGVPGFYSKAKSGSEKRDFELPDNPTRLIGWDYDGDGKYPPHDQDDTSILDGSAVSGAFNNHGISYFEMAHFTAKDFGSADAGLPKKDFGHFFQIAGRGSDPSSHIFIHDLSLLNINKGQSLYGNRMVFNWWGAGWLNHIAIVNIEVIDFGAHFIRGSGDNSGINEGGPFRWQNMTLKMHGCSIGSTCPNDSSQAGWGIVMKLWGYISKMEFIDNIVDGNRGAWVSHEATGITMAQCSQDWTIRNNEF